MDLFEFTNPVEAKLARKAQENRLPIGGTMELLPLCNMDCKMCYIRLSKAQMEAEGRMLSCDEWLRIAREAKEAGVLFLLITGGEPLLYPEFERLYTTLASMGFVISINTNGTLINEKWADMFGKYPCRVINITLYGTDDETYGRLCRNPKGFTQVMNAVKLLEERNIRFLFKCSLTPDNAKQIPQLHQIARDHHTELHDTGYMFPPVRKEGLNTEGFIRLKAKDVAVAKMMSTEAMNPGKNIKEVALHFLQRIGKANPKKMAELEGPNCNAGRNGFWINWKGEMHACGMLNEPKASLLQHSFAESWAYITEESKKIKRCQKCDKCEYMGICPSCSASCLAETGSTDGCPEFLCEYTKELVRLCQKVVEA